LKLGKSKINVEKIATPSTDVRAAWWTYAKSLF
jgi:hypothetical protein